MAQLFFRYHLPICERRFRRAYKTPFLPQQKPGYGRGSSVGFAFCLHRPLTAFSCLKAAHTEAWSPGLFRIKSTMRWFRSCTPDRRCSVFEVWRVVSCSISSLQGWRQANCSLPLPNVALVWNKSDSATTRNQSGYLDDLRDNMGVVVYALKSKHWPEQRHTWYQALLILRNGESLVQDLAA